MRIGGEEGTIVSPLYEATGVTPASAVLSTRVAAVDDPASMPRPAFHPAIDPSSVDAMKRSPRNGPPSTKSELNTCPDGLEEIEGKGAYAAATGTVTFNPTGVGLFVL